MAKPNEIDNKSNQEGMAEDAEYTKVGSTKEPEEPGSREPEKTDPDKRKPREAGKVQPKRIRLPRKARIQLPLLEEMVNPRRHLHNPSLYELRR
jgi:hypothetical protein